jgi:hypothetical protein
MINRRKVEKKDIVKKGGEKIGSMKTVTKTDRMGEVKKVKSKFKGDKDYLQKRREQVKKAEVLKERKRNLDAGHNVKPKTAQKIMEAPVELGPKEKKQKEAIKTRKSGSLTGNRMKIKTGASTGETYKSKSVTKIPRAERKESAAKKKEAAKPTYGIESNDGAVRGWKVTPKKTNKKK